LAQNLIEDVDQNVSRLNGARAPHNGRQAHGALACHRQGSRPAATAAGLHLTGGQAHDLAGADHLLPRLETEQLIADKAYNADKRVIEPPQQAGKSIVIPPKSNRRVARAFDKDLYKARHLIENFCAKLKQFRAIETRYDKLARNFLAGVHFAAVVIFLN